MESERFLDTGRKSYASENFRIFWTTPPTYHNQNNKDIFNWFVYTQLKWKETVLKQIKSSNKNTHKIIFIQQEY